MARTQQLLWPTEVTTTQARNLRRLIEVLNIMTGREGCFPFRRTIAERMGCSTGTVDRALALADDLGVIERQSRITPAGQSSNFYVILWERVRQFCRTDPIEGLLPVTDQTQWQLLNAADFTSPPWCSLPERAAPPPHLEEPPHQDDEPPPHLEEPPHQDDEPYSKELSPPPRPVQSTNQSPPVERGLLKIWRWDEDLSREDLCEPDRLQQRFDELVRKGVVAGDSDRVNVFAFARYCLREGKDPPALFNAGMRSPDRFKRTWRGKPTQDDDEWARQSIRELDQGPALPRVSNLGVDPPDDLDRVLDALTPAQLRRLVRESMGESWLPFFEAQGWRDPPERLRPQLKAYLAEIRDAQLAGSA